MNGESIGDFESLNCLSLYFPYKIRTLLLPYVFLSISNISNSYNKSTGSPARKERGFGKITDSNVE